MTADQLHRLKKWFASTVRSYRSPDGDIQTNIRLKAHHTHQVCAEARGLGRSLNLDPADLRLSEGAALLHDVGRFEQYRRFRTFNDARSVDHAELGLELLRNGGAFVGLTEEEAAIIIDAIRAHNQPFLPPGLGTKALLVSQILRDADKLDIWRIVIDYHESAEEKRNGAVVLGLPESPGVSREVLHRLSAGLSVLRKDLRNVNDLKLFHIGWAYDVNLPPTFRAVRRRHYIERLGGMLPQSTEIQDAVRGALRFVVEKGQGPEKGSGSS